MNTECLALVISVLTLILTAIGVYITYKEYIYRKRGKPKVNICKHNKSNRTSLTKISVAFIIKVTKK